MSLLTDVGSVTDASEVLSTLHIQESDSESETETVISLPQRKGVHHTARYSAQMNPNGGSMEKLSDSNVENQNIKDNVSSDSEEDMGTMLIGETLPGYYANPVRITSYNGRYRQSPFDKRRDDMTWGSGGGYGAVHPQSVAQVAYSESH